MSNYGEDDDQDGFRWTFGRVMLGEVLVLMFGIILLVPIMFVGVALTGVKEGKVSWWFDLYFGGVLLVGLAGLSIPITAFVAFVAYLARD